MSPIFANGAVTAAFSRAFNDEADHGGSDEDLIDKGRVAVGLEGKAKVKEFFEFAASGEFGDDGIKLKQALGHGRRVRLAIDTDGVTKVTIKGDKSFSLDTNLSARLDSKVSGLRVSIALNPDGVMMFRIGGQLNFPGVAQFYGGAFFRIDPVNYAMGNTGLLGRAARALRDHGDRLDRQIRNAGG